MRLRSLYRADAPIYCAAERAIDTGVGLIYAHGKFVDRPCTCICDGTPCTRPIACEAAVCVVTDVWSGLKLVVHKELRVQR